MDIFNGVFFFCNTFLTSGCTFHYYVIFASGLYFYGFLNLKVAEDMLPAHDFSFYGIDLSIHTSKWFQNLHTYSTYYTLQDPTVGLCYFYPYLVLKIFKKTLFLEAS